MPGEVLIPPGKPILHWKWLADDNGPNDAKQMAASALDTSTAGWADTNTGDDVFKGREGYAWYRTTLPEFKGRAPVLHFERIDDNGTIYLNGKLIDSHEGWSESFDVDLKPAWKTQGPNILAVLVQNTNGEGGITRPAQLQEGQATLRSGPVSPTFNDSAWTKIHLPDDFIVREKFSPTADANHGSLPVTTGWYRKTFDLPSDCRGKSMWIDFDGVYRDSMVWLNGHFLGRHASGYTSFRFDIEKYAIPGGKNVLAVHVDPTHFEGWWYEGGGIYRHVWLNLAEPVHASPWGTFVTAALPEPTPGKAPQPATVTAQIDVSNDGPSPAPVTVGFRFVDDAGRTIAQTTAQATIPAHGVKRAWRQVIFPQPRLWSLETRHLYRLIATVRRGAALVDSTETQFGIRTIRYDKDAGFFLNGKPVKIQGVCNHQDFIGVGIGVSDQLEEWRVKTLKDMGSNAWRMSHNPPTPSLLDACDRLGMLVMDENRHLGDSAGNLAEVASMVLRDRSHPSVIMWSMCNEQPEAGSTRGWQIFKAMRDTVLKLDSTRPVSSAMNSGWFGTGFTNVEDLMGVNYNIEVYDQFHKQHPNMPMFASETASTVTTRGEYADNRETVAVSSYNMTDETWRSLATRPFMAGSFVWTGFDYKGEPSPYGWPSINSHFGIMDMCGFPKDNYYYYQAWWKTQPMVHLMPHWNWPGKEGQDIRVIAFSNASAVELTLNGQSLGSKEMPKYGHLEWTVKYAPGTLLAQAFDANGKLIATDAVVTTGAPASIRLKTDRRQLASDGEDVSVVDAEILDAAGHVVPMADDLVKFTISGVGEVAGVGNGNPGDHDPDHSTTRHAFHGRCAAVIRAGEEPGRLHLTASAKGLKGATLDFTVSRP
jgi:beta-galactosidase